MSSSKTRINSYAEQQGVAVGNDAAAVSPFAWRGMPSELAGADKRMRSPIVRGAPGPASQITFSRKTPHSINTEIVDDKDKTRLIRGPSR